MEVTYFSICDVGKTQFNNYFPPLALVPGHVENLRSNRDPNRPSVTLHWDEPKNCELTGEVTAYEIIFRPSGWWIGECAISAVNAPATSILLTGKSGFNSLLPYDFEVRARNAYCEGEWSRVSEYTGTYYNLGVGSHQEIISPHKFLHIGLLMTNDRSKVK